VPVSSFANLGLLMVLGLSCNYNPAQRNWQYLCSDVDLVWAGAGPAPRRR
jgi:hypothetical protein